MAISVTFAQASKAGSELAGKSSSHVKKSNAGYVLATWRWQMADMGVDLR